MENYLTVDDLKNIDEYYNHIDMEYKNEEKKLEQMLNNLNIETDHNNDVLLSGYVHITLIFDHKIMQLNVKPGSKLICIIPYIHNEISENYELDCPEMNSYDENFRLHKDMFIRIYTLH